VPFSFSELFAVLCFQPTTLAEGLAAKRRRAKGGYFLLSDRLHHQIQPKGVPQRRQIDSLKDFQQRAFDEIHFGKGE
jgi:hypothetical protein